ncbi:secreted RxLR effector protein 161-like [Pyrus x bretschneideri]|uniref:secreted RxLR effector protein 161-like n=1 Tax=Pyrus x bretschneideri TaxID=225117 RepID=UPI00202EDACA|nr:secreted RxLR effector protein 161-like [Pyrus x bretschneideri]
MFNTEDSNGSNVPMIKGEKLSKDQCPKTNFEKKEMASKPYASLVGSFMYAQRTKEYQLVYKRDSKLELVGYSDSDFAGCLDSFKSTSGYIFMLANGAVSWKSVKQDTVTTSTMQPEFVACYEATLQAIWLRNFISNLEIMNSIAKPV